MPDTEINDLVFKTVVSSLTANSQRSHIPRSYTEIGNKAAARILLSDRLSGIIVPTKEEWIGVNLLERDGELTQRQGGADGLFQIPQKKVE